MGVLLGKIADVLGGTTVVAGKRVGLDKALGGGGAALGVKVDPGFVEGAVAAFERGRFAPLCAGGLVELVEGIGA